jgi:biopolymer transport protein ExbD
MAIHRPGPRLCHEIPLEHAKKGGHGKRSVYAELYLTSLVDMFMILVVFLLETFSATGEIAFVQKNIILPEAVNWKDLERAPIIGVAADVVTLDGSKVADAEDLQKENTVDWKISKLHDDLVTLKNNYKMLHPDQPFNGLAIVQAHKDIDFKILKKVMYSAAVAGYSNLNFAVQSRGKGGGG